MRLFIYIFIILFAEGSLAQNNSVRSSGLYEQMPVYPGGNGEMMKFISKNMNYSVCTKASQDCSKGLVGCHKMYLSFIVSESGKIKEAKVLKGIKDCPESDIEVLRVLNLMPNWIPATINGKPSDCKMNLPMNIMLKQKYCSN